MSPNGKDQFYYDACVLGNKDAYRELVNLPRSASHVPCISYLAMGEAFTNSLRKGEGRLEAFSEFIEALVKIANFIEIDGAEAELEAVRDKFPHLKLADALHLALAMKYCCKVLRTTDSDLLGLSPHKLSDLANQLGLSTFSISQPEPKKKGY